MAYFSNGMEGACFDEQCSLCVYGDKPCPIALVQMEYNYEAVNNEVATKILDTLVNNDGECSMFNVCKEDFYKDDDEDIPKIKTLDDLQKEELLNEIFGSYSYLDLLKIKGKLDI